MLTGFLSKIPNPESRIDGGLPPPVQYAVDLTCLHFWIILALKFPMRNAAEPIGPRDEEVQMIWSTVRQAYPDQWLIIEALAAHTQGNQRLLDQIAVIETCDDGAAAMQSYQRLHREYPSREFYFVHTGREHLDIRERRWMGVRRADAAYAEG